MEGLSGETKCVVNKCIVNRASVNFVIHAQPGHAVKRATPVAGCYFFTIILSLFVSDIVLLIIINFVFYRLMYFLTE